MSDLTAPHRTMVKVDCHAHVFLCSLPLADDRRYVPTADAPLAAYLAHLDRSQFTHGVLVQPSFLGTDNAFLLSSLHAAGGRLRGVAVVDSGVSTSELGAMADTGVVGIRFNLIGKTAPRMEMKAWQTILDFVARHRWHVEVHAHAAQLPIILPPLLAHGIRVVVDHFGRPDPQRGVNDPGFAYLLSTSGTGQVWVKLSASYRLGTAKARLPVEAAAELLAAFGAERLVWGSDWPHTTHEQDVTFEQTTRSLAVWVSDAATRHRLLGATAAELFHIDNKGA